LSGEWVQLPKGDFSHPLQIPKGDSFYARTKHTNDHYTMPFACQVCKAAKKCFKDKSSVATHALTMKGPPVMCKEHAEANMVRVVSCYCRGCEKVAGSIRLVIEGKKVWFCASCANKQGDFERIRQTRQPCECGRVSQPAFGYTGETPRCCDACKKPDMINVRARLCETCKKRQRRVDYRGRDHPRYCGVCAQKMDRKNMISYFTQKCKCEIPKIPTFGYPGKEAEFCSKCRPLSGTCDVINLKCNYTSPIGRRCNNFPRYGVVGRRRAVFCREHKPNTSEWVNVVDRHCEKHGTRASFVAPGEKTAKYCALCAPPGCHDTNAYCKHPDCVAKVTGTRACFASNIDARPIDAEYCSKHAPDGYVDVGNRKRCPGANGKKGPDGKCALVNFGLRKLCGFCSTCFAYQFPNSDEIPYLHQHVYELIVRDALQRWYPTIDFMHNNPIDVAPGCSCPNRRRVDFHLLIKGTILAIEVDEYGHANYNREDEEIRYDDLFMQYSGNWVFIRYNPHGKGSIDQLKDQIDHQMARIEHDESMRDENSELVEICYV